MTELDQYLEEITKNLKAVYEKAGELEELVNDMASDGDISEAKANKYLSCVSDMIMC
jgi:polyhydroxyalkanoate synthesis regulator phasin